MSSLNLGIVAHVDAGKTSLTERLLFHAGVIDRVGSVDDGSTRTDSLALERRRGITIKSAVVSFRLGGTEVNLIDTPGHPDFIAEVERVLSVLDGAVLVISAVEGVQAQTRVLLRTLRRLGVPTLIFVNKVDRGGADPRGVLAGIGRRLTDAAVPMGTVARAGGAAAAVEPFPSSDEDFLAEATEVLTRGDDALLADYLDGAAGPQRVGESLRAATRAAAAHPVYFGSAVTGVGVAQLADGITRLLTPAAAEASGEVSASVFKVDRGPAGQRLAYARIFGGTLRLREQVRYGAGRSGRITGIGVFADGEVRRASQVGPGRIALLSGLDEVHIADAIGTAPVSVRHHFAPPSLETVVTPVRVVDSGRLHDALTILSEQDPLIDLRRDDVRDETSVSLYGEVQKEVIESTLAEEFGVAVTFRESTTVHIERPVGVGEVWEDIGDAGNPFLAGVGLRVEPGPIGSGLEFRLGVEQLGRLPLAFIKAVEETVPATAAEGLYGWRVTDCVVTLTRSHYYPRMSKPHQKFDKSVSSTAGDFRNLTPLVLLEALRRAGTVVHEPVHRFDLELPIDGLAAVMPVLARLGGLVHTTESRRDGYLLDGEIPAARVHELEQRLPGLTRGEGLYTGAFDHYRAVSGVIPRRERSDNDPLNRREYLLRVQRRVRGL